MAKVTENIKSTKTCFVRFSDIFIKSLLAPTRRLPLKPLRREWLLAIVTIFFSKSKKLPLKILRYFYESHFLALTHRLPLKVSKQENS